MSALIEVEMLSVETKDDDDDDVLYDADEYKAQQTTTNRLTKMDVYTNQPVCHNDTVMPISVAPVILCICQYQNSVVAPIFPHM